MSGASNWRYHRPSLSIVLDTWEATNPSPHERTQVQECLMDVVRSPMTRGRPDPDHPDMWEARVDETNAVFTYVPNHPGPFEIWSWDLSAPLPYYFPTHSE